MKNYIKYFCAVLLLIGTSANAWGLVIREQIEIKQGAWTNYQDGSGYYNGIKYDVTMKSTQIYKNGSSITIPANGSVIILAPSGGTVEKIKFSPNKANGGMNHDLGVSSGTYTKANSTWNGNASSVTLTAPAESNMAWDAATITIKYESDSYVEIGVSPSSKSWTAAIDEVTSGQVFTISGLNSFDNSDMWLCDDPDWEEYSYSELVIGGHAIFAVNATTASSITISATGDANGTYNAYLAIEGTNGAQNSGDYQHIEVFIPLTLTVAGCPSISGSTVTVGTVTPTWDCTNNRWEATVSCDEVANATKYGFTLKSWSGSAWTTASAESWQTGRSKTYTLTQGTRYKVEVRAKNDGCVPNTTTAATTSNEFTPTCPAVTGLTAVAEPTMTAAAIEWEATGGAGCDMLYEVTVKKHSDNSTVWTQSPASSTTSATVTGLTSNTQYDVYVTATNDCGNSNDNSGAAVETFTTTKGYTDNKWTCIDLRLVQTDGNTSDPLLMTGGYSLGTSSVEASRTLTLTIGGVTANSTVQLSGTNLKFFKDNVARTEITSSNLTCDISGNLSAVIHVAYAPSAYTDDNIATPSITVTCDGNVREFAGLVKARCLPEKFVVAAKINGRWCALPADLATSSGTTVQDAYPISVDNLNAPRVATVVPKNAVYGFKARNAVTSHTGGIRLTSKIDETVYHLQAPRSNSLTYLWRTTSNSTKGMQEWYLTSTGKTESAFYTYNIGVDPDIYVSSGSGDGEGEGDSGEKISRYLCVYDNKIYWGATATKTFRILPVEDEIEPVDMQVVEWKADKVVFMYLGNPAYKASVEINGVLKSAASTSLSSLEVDHGVYEIAVNDLMTSAYQPLYIIIKNGETEIGRKTVTVPLLVNTTTTIDEARTAVGITNKNDCQNVDLVVLNGGKLSSGETTESSQFTFNSISVYGGGKLILPEDNYLTAKKMYLRAGTVNGGTYQYVYPQIYVGTNAMLTINDNIINFDYLTTKDQYYALALPFSTTVDNSHITYPVDIYGETYAKGGSYLMDIFNGATRAAQGAVDAVWEDVEDVTTTRGLGYYFLGMPRKVSVNGGSATRQEYGIQRIQLSTSSALAIKTHENGDTQIAVTAHPSAQPFNAGWWYLGNPYMADLGGAGVTDDGTKKEITMGYLTNAGGTWDWAEKNVRYVTVPNDDASDTYDQRPVSGYNFPAFKTFFVQVGHDGYVKFGNASRSTAAPIRFSATGMPTEIETSIALNSELYGDTTHILIGNEFTDDYEPGDDLVKMPHANVSLFTITGGNELFANALNMQSALAGIPVGYTAPTSGMYVFSKNDNVYSSWIGSLWLTDFELNQKVDLMEQNYVFTTDAGTNKTRFVLNVELRSPGDDTTTDIEEIEETDETSTKKFIYQDKMYIQFNGVIYDATGKRVKEINK